MTDLEFVRSFPLVPATAILVLDTENATRWLALYAGSVELLPNERVVEDRSCTEMFIGHRLVAMLTYDVPMQRWVTLQAFWDDLHRDAPAAAAALRARYPDARRDKWFLVAA